MNPPSEETKMALVQQDILLIKDSIESINIKLDDKYATKEEIKPIKMLVYGCTAIMLSSMVMALVYLVVNSNSTPVTSSTIINK